MLRHGIAPMRSLDQSKPRAFSYSMPSLPISSDSSFSGTFTNLKLAADKLVREQASIKTDLNLANEKLKNSMDHVKVLEQKLQNAFNENAKLKAKIQEDEKLWKGLEFKFTSTKSLCDNLSEVLHQLTTQVQDAEKDKRFIESQLSAALSVVDVLNQQFNNLFSKLNSAEKTIKIRDQELKESGEHHIETQRKLAALIDEKDNMLKKSEETAETNRKIMENLKSELHCVQCELQLKTDEVKVLKSTQETIENEKNELQLICSDNEAKLAASLQELAYHKELLAVCASQVSELDRQSMDFIEKFNKLVTMCDAMCALSLEDKLLASKKANHLHGHLIKKHQRVESEKFELHSVNNELQNKILEMEKSHESTVERISKQCSSAEETIKKMESETEHLNKNIEQSNATISELMAKITKLSDRSKLSDIKMQELLRQIATLETEKKDLGEKVSCELQNHEKQADALKHQIEKEERKVESFEKQIVQLNKTMEEKEQAFLRLLEKEKLLEKQILEMQSLVSLSDNKLSEAKKQHDIALEAKQQELSKHLKELSLRNDQAINEMRNKYETEKLEILKMEEEKARKQIEEMEEKITKQLVDCQEEASKKMANIEEEHAKMIQTMQEEHAARETNLNSIHVEEIKRVTAHVETELREKLVQQRTEYEVKIKALQCQHEDECKNLQEVLYLQKTKEDRQRALLQLQWRVMSDTKPQEDNEVNSKMDYSMSSIKKRDPGESKRNRRHFLEEKEKVSMGLRITQTPVSKLLQKVAKCDASLSQKKITDHDEYDVEPENAKPITKRRKIKNTGMVEDPIKPTPTAVTPRAARKGIKTVAPLQPSNIGDLFSEGSLNPYADDPYAFD